MTGPADILRAYVPPAAGGTAEEPEPSTAAPAPPTGTSPTDAPAPAGVPASEVPPADVVVVGGGIIGLTVAWRATRFGMTVTVCDPAPGRATSWVAAGMLAPVTEARAAEAPLVRLGLTSLQRWPSFAAELAADAGGDVDDLGLRRDGTLQVAFDDDDRRALDELHQVHQVLGLASERVSGTRCRELEPMLSPWVRAGLVVPGDWQVDPRLVVGALGRALERRGGQVVRAEARRLLRAGDGSGPATGVALADGTVLHGRSVVLATGAAAVPLQGVPERAVPPVRPVKGEILRLRADPAAPPLTRTVRGTVKGQHVYVVPRRSGELVVGATMQEAGHDTLVRAGAVLDLLRNATDLVPVLGELSLAEAVAGLRPTTFDNGPALGPTAVPGLHVALGHFRNGVLLAPVTGDAVVDALAGGELRGPASAFGVARFG